MYKKSFEYCSFSENVQEIKLIDQNLNEIQTIDLKQKFGFIKQAYVEDLQKSLALRRIQKSAIVL